MTRKEEIKTSARLYSPNNAHHTADVFEYGAEWADRTMIRKACEWLRDNAGDYVVHHWNETVLDTTSLVLDFKQAMEE